MHPSHLVMLVEESSMESVLSALLPRTAQSGDWQLVNRIVVEELEAWYFGDWDAVCAAYPRVNPTVPNRSQYRDPDDIRGGTWEAFERILKRSGYFKTGLRKVEAARAVGTHFEPKRNRSRSFGQLCDAITETGD